MIQCLGQPLAPVRVKHEVTFRASYVTATPERRPGRVRPWLVIVVVGVTPTARRKICQALNELFAAHQLPEIAQ